MPKYQVILYSDIQLPDDEFLYYCQHFLSTGLHSFEVVSAQNLEGVREEVYTYVNQNPESPSYGALVSERKPAGNEDLL